MEVTQCYKCGRPIIFLTEHRSNVNKHPLDAAPSEYGQFYVYEYPPLPPGAISHEMKLEYLLNPPLKFYRKLTAESAKKHVEFLKTMTTFFGDLGKWPLDLYTSHKDTCTKADRGRR
jgi:hypothetical protein